MSLSKKTIDLCIEKLNKEYKILLRYTGKNEIGEILINNELYTYEKALTELRAELQNIEDESLSE